MKRSALAKRYARAFVDFAGSNSDAGKLADELSLFQQAVDTCDDLKSVMHNPRFAAQRDAVLESVIAELKLSRPCQQVLALLVQRDRLRYVGDIAEAIRQQVEEKTGRVRATVVSVKPLPEDRYQRIRAAVERITGKMVVLEKLTDPNLIGGIVTHIGSTVYDGSVRSQLNRFRSSIGKES